MTFMDHSGEDAQYAFVADLYDYVVPYRERKDVDFFVEAAEESRGPVLEVGCGTGRVLIPTAQAGIEMVGLDLSPHMLHVCQEHLGREPADVQSRVRLVQADMRNFAMSQTFRLATLPFRSFQHLTTVEDQRACLETIHRHLLPGGKLVLDVFNPNVERKVDIKLGQEFGDEPEFTTPDGRRVVRCHKVVAIDRFNQVNSIELIYDITHADGRRERLVHAFSMRYLFRFEAEHLLARCGFRVDAVYADYDKSPYGSQYPGELILMATRDK